MRVFTSCSTWACVAAAVSACTLWAIDVAAQPAPSGGSEPEPGAPPSAPPNAGAPNSDATALAKAKELFRAGVELFQAGDLERALDYFMRSRAAYASSKNTINAALCLDKLGRYDEALELYEEVLTRFSKELDDDSRAAMAPAMTSLRNKVGSIDVSANVEGSVVIDGRARGKLPLTSALRVLGGRHVVRVLKDGYATAETTVDVQVGHTARVDVRLAPLAAAGSLRIEDPSGVGGELFVDRVSVGTTPWEGTLGPGKHLVWSRKGDLGSPPTEAVVVQGQTILLRLKSMPLGPPVSVTLKPSSAELLLDGVSLGNGNWDGRLPTGHHRLEAREAGYFPSTREFEVPAAGASPVHLDLRLAIDRADPRWPKPAPLGELWIGLEATYLVMPSLASDAEAACPARCTNGPSTGGIQVGARAGYRFPFGLSVELGGGYLTLGSKLTRSVDDHYGDSAQYPVTFDLSDDLRVSGPFVSVGADERIRIAKHGFFLGRAEGGIVFAGSRDHISGTARTPASSTELPISMSGASEPTRSVAVFLSPELAFGYSVNKLDLSAGVTGLWFVTAGPALSNGGLTVPVNCPNGANPASVGCVQIRNTVANERGFGRLLAFGPRVSASYAF